MMTTEYDDETKLSEIKGVDYPEWIIDRNLRIHEIKSIAHGGCASGAYMPAVDPQSMQTMGEHGDDVLEYIEIRLGDLPQIENAESWLAISSFYLSKAVELWAISLLDQLESGV